MTASETIDEIDRLLAESEHVIANIMESVEPEFWTDTLRGHVAEKILRFDNGMETTYRYALFDGHQTLETEAEIRVHPIRVDYPGGKWGYGCRVTSYVNGVSYETVDVGTVGPISKLL